MGHSKNGRIAELAVTSRTVPLVRPWGSDVPVNHVIVCEVTLDDGQRGTGFTWTPQIGAEASHVTDHFVVDADGD